MNYSKSLHYLDSFLNLEKLSQFPNNSFFNLRRMEHLLRISGRPDKEFFPVLIAGTTGKGSTGFFLESILKENKIAVGYYHSPHVEDVRERIRLDGLPASRKAWSEGLSRIKTLLARNPLPEKFGSLTYFEIMTFLAILLFARAEKKIGIFEIGLGGRLDATNVLKASLVILTPIHLDHEHILGNTVEKIAHEKAGIIKNHCYVVSTRQISEAAAVIRQTCRREQACFLEAVAYREKQGGLAGDFQKVNSGAAIQAARVLRLAFGFRIDPASYPKAIVNRNWPGRMERICRNGLEFFLDGAHNPVSVSAFARAFPLQGTPWLVFAAMQDKDSGKMLKILSKHFQKLILLRTGHSRSCSVGILFEQAKGLFKCVLPAQNVAEALSLAKVLSFPEGKIAVTGSFYLVGEARKLLKPGTCS